MSPRRFVRHILLLAAPVALLLGGLGLRAAPAHATGYCVYVFPQPDTGVEVCTPWN